MRLGRPDYCASESRIRDPEPGEDPVPNVRDMELGMEHGTCVRVLAVHVGKTSRRNIG